MQTSATIRVEAQINGKAFGAFSYSIKASAHGSSGSCDIHTSVEMLKASGVDLIGLAEQAAESLPVDIYVTIDQDRNHFFGGEYVKAQWNYDTSTVMIHCRDWTGVLMDEKRVLTKQSGVETQNQKVGDLVSSIAKEYGLKPVLHLQEGGNSQNIGTEFGSKDRTYMPRAQTAWATLTQLAKSNGYEVHTTPDKELVFGVPGAGLPTLTLSYDQGEGSLPDGAYPVKALEIEHNPRRNKSFKVVVQSYDPTKAQTTKGQAVVVGSNTSTSSDETVNAGQWGGSQATAAGNALSGGKKKVPTYTFRVDGLTPDQAQKKADAIATDIAKRELILSAESDGIPGIQLMQKVKLVGPTIEGEFAAHDYWVNSFTHHMEMSHGRDHVAQFSTTLKALDVQESGEGDSVSKGKGGHGRGKTTTPSDKAKGFVDSRHG